MSSALPTHDTRPWFRQFWPWFLISLPGAVVIAGLTTFYIANEHSDDLVAEEYYKDGLAINRQLEKSQRAIDQGLNAALVFSKRDGVQWVEVHITGSVPKNVISLSLSHPLEADRDFIVTLTPREAGIYIGELPAPIAARWHWIIESSGANPWRLNGTVVANDLSNEPEK